LIAFIPIRSNSKRIINKNIKLLWGKPLCYWSIRAANLSKVVDKIIVATDSIEYINIIKSFKFKKVKFFKRSDCSSQSNSKTEDVIKEYFFSQKEKSNLFFLIQVTNPFLKSKDLENAFKTFKKKKYDSMLSVVPFNRFLWTKKKPINYNLSKRPMSQNIEYFLENGSFYITNKNHILKKGQRLFGKIGMFEMSFETIFEIDEIEDFKFVNRLNKFK